MKKVKTNDNKNFKCPLCGNEEFVEGIVAIPEDFGSTYIAHSYTCFECGYMFLVNKEFIELKQKITSELSRSFEKLENAIKVFNKEAKPIKAELSKLEDKAKVLNEELKDNDRTVKRDGEIKAELERLKKDIDSKLSELHALKSEVLILKEGLDRYFRKNPNNAINNHLNEKYQKILSKFKGE